MHSLKQLNSVGRQLNSVEQGVVDYFRTHLQNAITGYDFDQNGVVHRHELARMIRDVGYNQYTAEAMSANIFHVLDTDCNGYIDLRDLQGAICGTGGGQGALSSVEQGVIYNFRTHLQNAIAAYDFDQNNVVQQYELTCMLKQSGYDQRTAEAMSANIIRELDTDCNGYIDMRDLQGSGRWW